MAIIMAFPLVSNLAILETSEIPTYDLDCNAFPFSIPHCYIPCLRAFTCSGKSEKVMLLQASALPAAIYSRVPLKNIISCKTSHKFHCLFY
jgi:hypothetical protein